MVTTRRQARSEASASPAPSPAPAPSKPAPVAKEDLPPPKKDKGVRSVSPPLRGVSLSRFFYALAAVAGAIALWYVYHAAQIAVDLVRGTVPSAPGFGVGWGLGSGGRDRNAGGDSDSRAGAGKGTVESRIEELARALGVKSPELANAIAGVVREYVPPATLSSIASQARKTGGSQVVDALVGEKPEGGASQGVMGGVGDTLGKVVGMDDVPEAV
ncbi:hypothetical protein DENSPDRAFT_219286 [Dentipellis sp. KUC8613]|nr:hypothetical protein DENSPDRAFT_219286 [Dentipellis sp. KUC8613]